VRHRCGPSGDLLGRRRGLRESGGRLVGEWRRCGPQLASELALGARNLASELPLGARNLALDRSHLTGKFMRAGPHVIGAGQPGDQPWCPFPELAELLLAELGELLGTR